ncbi:hypothetical protein LDENG_00262440 [Lucifuga dentata]|nr:hypothetical protein LDENG_00262440 [Lucifuga dentata]
MSSQNSFLLLIILWASIQDGLGLPVMKHQEMGSSDVVPTHRVRSKRCACSNQLDSECHYFCHLDIIWVTTPSKTTVYGLGSAVVRHRRATGRCACANTNDHICTDFCSQSLGISSPKIALRRLLLNLLSILRSLKRAQDAEERYESSEEEDTHET